MFSLLLPLKHFQLAAWRWTFVQPGAMEQNYSWHNKNRPREDCIFDANLISTKLSPDCLRVRKLAMTGLLSAGNCSTLAENAVVGRGSPEKEIAAHRRAQCIQLYEYAGTPLFRIFIFFNHFFPLLCLKDFASSLRYTWLYLILLLYTLWFGMCF